MRLCRLHLLLVVVAVLDTSCWITAGSNPSSDSKQNQQAKEDAKTPIAIVNGAEIPKAVFDKAYTQAVARYTQTGQSIKPALAERLKDSIVQWLVDQQIVREQANKLGLQVSTEELQRHWAEHKKRYGPRASFEIFLRQAKSTEEEIKNSFANNLLREKLFRHISAKVRIEQAEIEQYYDANRSSYNQEESVHVAHILIRIPKDISSRERKRRFKLARRVASKAQKRPETFDKLAKDFSEDETTKNRGGDFGPFKRGQMIAAFERVAFEMKPNTISGVVESPYGFHIIKKIAHHRARSKTLKDVRDQIEQTLLSRERNQAVKDTFRRWKQESNVQIFIRGDQSVINSTYDTKNL